MDFTFGIITGGGNDQMIVEIVSSIVDENIPNYEIIIVGNSQVSGPNITVIPFDESIHRAWITKKKNLITQHAQYENVVYLHDYIKLEAGWYQGQLASGSDFHIRMDKIVNFDGSRFRDWCIWPHNGNLMDSIIRRGCLIPYDITHLSKYMYISGSYWIAKKSVMEEYPLNEQKLWGQGEDVEWSMAVRLKYDFNMNVNSSVRIMKAGKDRAFEETSPIMIEQLKRIK